jgi:hypothetical protein
MNRLPNFSIIEAPSILGLKPSGVELLPYLLTPQRRISSTVKGSLRGLCYSANIQLAARSTNASSQFS